MQNVVGGERADPRIVAAEETCDPHGMGGAGSVPAVDATERVPHACDGGAICSLMCWQLVIGQ